MTPADLKQIVTEARVAAVLSLQHDQCLAYWGIDYEKMHARGAKLGLQMARSPMRDFNVPDQRRKLPRAVAALAHLQGCVAILPSVTLRGAKRKNPLYPTKLETIGDHIRANRLDLGLKQRDVAAQLGINIFTLVNWEKNKTVPPVHYDPRIISFLGYCPYQRAETFGDRIRLFRVHQGLSLRAMAEILEVDPGSLSRWETGGATADKAGDGQAYCDASGPGGVAVRLKYPIPVQERARRPGMVTQSHGEAAIQGHLRCGRKSMGICGGSKISRGQLTSFQ